MAEARKLLGREPNHPKLQAAAAKTVVAAVEKAKRGSSEAERQLSEVASNEKQLLDGLRKYQGLVDDRTRLQGRLDFFTRELSTENADELMADFLAGERDQFAPTRWQNAVTVLGSESVVVKAHFPRFIAKLTKDRDALASWIKSFADECLIDLELAQQVSGVRID